MSQAQLTELFTNTDHAHRAALVESNGEDPERRDELIEARGRATVPMLWIKSPEGEVRWMPESLDIIRYLEHMYGE